MVPVPVETGAMIWIPDGLKITGAATRAVSTNGAEKILKKGFKKLTAFVFGIPVRILSKIIDEFCRRLLLL